MLKPDCAACRHLSRNQCEKDKANPINMEIGTIGEYVTDPEKVRSCPHYEQDSNQDSPYMR